MPAERPRIHPDSITVGIAQAIRPNGQIRNLERLVVVGGVAPTDRTHVHLGTLPQIHRHLEQKQGIDPMQKREIEAGRSNPRVAFLESLNWLPTSQINNHGKLIDSDKIRKGFWGDDESFIEGPHARAIMLREAPIIDQSQISLWATLVTAFGAAWMLLEER